MRVFIGLTEIAGVGRGLREGFERLGAEVTFVDLSRDPFSYGGATAGLRLRQVHEQVLSGRGIRVSVALRVRAALKAGMIGRLAATHDLFVFLGRTSFFDFREAALLRRLGRPSVHILLGSDSRPPYVDGALVGDGGVDPARVVADARRWRADLAKLEAAATVVVNHPPQAQFARRPYVPLLRIGLPVTPPRIAAEPVAVTRGPVRLLHCPSDRGAKGTASIRAAVDRLRDGGHRFEYVEASGRSNRDVRYEIARCDLLLDQMYSDTPMAAAATEAAWLGRPALVGGYAAGAWDLGLAEEERPPSFYCHPQRFAPTLERLVQDREALGRIGAAAQNFVAARWKPDAVARRILSLAHGTDPRVCVDPRRLQYVHGFGLSETRLREVVGAVLRHGGRNALQLSDRPDLEQRLVDIAG